MASEVFCFHCGAAHAETSGFCHSCGQALLLGKRYHVLEQLGSGGFGEVYHAEDVQAGSRPVALKRLLLSTILPHEQPKAIEAFQNEGQMIAQLKHPGLPELYDQFEEQGAYYLVLEFLPGETLERLLERQGTRLLPVSMVVQFGIELASVLSYLHTRQPPVVFRDLKPANVMVAPDSQVRLIDFGIARRFLRDEKKHTENLGTPGYASPEHYSLVTPLSDIYSLGAMLHELLSGEKPGSHGLFLYPELHLQGAPEKRLATLVSRLVKRNAHRRPRNALQVKRELQAILEALSLPGPLPSLSLPAVKSGPPVPKQLPSVTPVQPKPGDLSYTYPYSSQSIRALAWSPDGQYLAALGEDPSQLLVWSTHSHQLILTQRVFREPLLTLAWSPDSKQIALAGKENIISIWQLSGVCVSSYIGHQGTIQSLFWSPQDDMIISGDEHHQIHCWKTKNGKQLRVETLPGEWNSDCKILVQAFSPQGKYLAMLDDNRYACLRPFHLASNREGILSHWKHMSRHQALGSTLSWSPAGDRLAWGFRDGSVWLWNVPYRSTRPGGSYRAHKSCVSAIAWSSTDKVIATSGEEGTVHLWSVTPKGAQRLVEGLGSTTFIYKGHAKTVKALAWSPVGEQLASAGSDGSIHIWHAAR